MQTGRSIQTFADDSRLELFYQYTDANLDFTRPVDNYKTTNERREEEPDHFGSVIFPLWAGQAAEWQ
ncbi:hypothetical protein [Pseudomonas sp. D3-10]|uniref:hypothetical protein n=1 Tax=Pseudomonas sp. D3-10 TaxID=2817392 RepID=UPI003DA8B212